MSLHVRILYGILAVLPLSQSTDGFTKRSALDHIVACNETYNRILSEYVTNSSWITEWARRTQHAHDMNLLVLTLNPSLRVPYQAEWTQEYDELAETTARMINITAEMNRSVVDTREFLQRTIAYISHLVSNEQLHDAGVSLVNVMDETSQRLARLRYQYLKLLQAARRFQDSMDLLVNFHDYIRLETRRLLMAFDFRLW
jgi:hypothetical protein